jgi:hypothetical protein
MGYAFFSYYCVYLAMLQYYDEWDQILIWAIIDSVRLIFILVANPVRKITYENVKSNILDLTRIGIQIYYIYWDHFYSQNQVANPDGLQEITD